MAKIKQQFGQKSEQLAITYLKRQGYAIVETNWQCPFGEIDIVARKDDTLVFVEVRARHSHNTEAAFASINNRKRARLQATAQSYLHSHNLDTMLWRIDVIAIAMPRYGDPIIEQAENALDW
jgi:putative endonuclease